MSGTEPQRQLVFWGYVIQWAAVFMPFTPLALVVSIVYLLITRRQVVEPSLRSHFDWQLMTCLVSAAIVVLAVALLVIGLSGVATDAPISMVATFTLLALVTVTPLWLLYRLVRGTLRFRGKLPMEALFP